CTSSEAYQNPKLKSVLPGKAEHLWSALSALHRKLAEDRPVEFGPPQGVSHHRDLRATPRQAHYSPLGKFGSTGDQVDGGREVVLRTEAGKRTEGKTTRRSDQ